MPTANTNTFDNNGHLSGSNIQYLSAQSGQGSNGYFCATTYFGGSTPLSNSIPDWCAEPDAGMAALRGYRATFESVLYWGFKFK